jgi:dTDP-4-amino-4,6-dideoxygalactose transaminase
MTVPFLDLTPSHKPISDGVLADVAEMLESGKFTNGPQVAAFEDAYATFCGTEHAVGTANGLDALRLALIALGLQPGDEVLVPAMTFIATFEAVTQAGGIPVPVDVTTSDYGMDPAALDAAIGSRTRAVMPVHLYGRMADMAAITAVAERHGLWLVEDACQAHGATRGGVRAGTAGHAGAFSFYPGKNLGAFGDAGALVTDDAELASRCRALREHGQQRKYEHDMIGWTSRLDTIQAAVLLRKLPLLEGWTDQRRAIADLYADGLAGVGDLILPDTSDRGQAWHLFVVRTADPEGLATHLFSKGIGTGRHYPEPPHLSGAYADLRFGTGTFPVAERLAREVLSFPMFPGLSPAHVAEVVDAVDEWFANGRSSP